MESRASSILEQESSVIPYFPIKLLLEIMIIFTVQMWDSSGLLLKMLWPGRVWGGQQPGYCGAGDFGDSVESSVMAAWQVSTDLFGMVGADFWPRLDCWYLDICNQVEPMFREHDGDSDSSTLPVLRLVVADPSQADSTCLTVKLWGVAHPWSWQAVVQPSANGACQTRLFWNESYSRVKANCIFPLLRVKSADLSIRGKPNKKNSSPKWSWF